MFGTSRRRKESFSRHRASKSTSTTATSGKPVPSKVSGSRVTLGKPKRSFKQCASSRRPTRLGLASSSSKVHDGPHRGPSIEALKTPMLTVAVGDPSLNERTSRLFSAHEGVLRRSALLQTAFRTGLYNSRLNVLKLPDETPELFSAILQYLYQGDYYPKMVFDNERREWTLENAQRISKEHDCIICVPPVPPTTPTSVFSATVNDCHILKDTAIYCAAERYSLPQLKILALRKQGLLQVPIPIATILASARYAYANTLQTDTMLRSHFLNVIVNSRDAFKRSTTMQMEMGLLSPPASPALSSPGPASKTRLWFDLFVAMCDRLDGQGKRVAGGF